MKICFAPFYLFRAVCLAFAVTLFGFTAYGQTAIEPCQASPAPNKQSPTPAKVGTHATETLVDSSIRDDPGIEKILAPYSSKVRALETVIGRVEGNLKTGGVGANTMGNFVTDGIKSVAEAKLGRPVLLAITNAGGLRKREIGNGEIRESDLWELLPFENALIEVDLTGAQLITLLQRLTRAHDAQAGARIHFRWDEQNRSEMIEAKLIDATGRERNIEPQATYTIITIDYLLKLASGNYAILQEGKNIRPLNVTIRDAMIQYVKSEAAAGRAIRARLDDRFIQVGPGPTRPPTTDPQ